VNEENLKTAGNAMIRVIKDLSAGVKKREGREKSGERACQTSERVLYVGAGTGL
jgi:hypothetical protein